MLQLLTLSGRKGCGLRDLGGQSYFRSLHVWFSAWGPSGEGFFGVQAHESSILRFVGLCMFASFSLAFWGLGDLEFRSLRSRVSGFRD